MRALVPAAALALAGCCNIFDDSWDHSVAPDPAPNAPALELGTAVYPPGTPEADATRHTWIAARLRPTTYRVGYALSQTEQASVDGSFRSAREVAAGLDDPATLERAKQLAFAFAPMGLTTRAYEPTQAALAGRLKSMDCWMKRPRGSCTTSAKPPGRLYPQTSSGRWNKRRCGNPASRNRRVGCNGTSGGRK